MPPPTSRAESESDFSRRYRRNQCSDQLQGYCSRDSLFLGWPLNRVLLTAPLHVAPLPSKSRHAGRIEHFFFTDLADTKVEVDKLPFCLVPTSHTFAAIDAIILTAHNLITIQVTISNIHSAKKSGFEKVSNSGIKNDRTWKHVFVTNEDFRARSLRQQALKDFPEGISIYSAVFDVGRSDITAKDLKAFEVSTSWHCTGLVLIGDTRNMLPKIVWTSTLGQSSE